MQKNTLAILMLLVGMVVGYIISCLYCKTLIRQLPPDDLYNLEQQPFADSISDNAAKRSEGEETTSNLLFKDTFDDNVNNWDTQLKSYGMKILYDGKYIIDYREDGYFWWSGMPLKRQTMNYDIVLKARHKSGTREGYYGLIQTVDTANYHRFCITKNGYTSINIKKGGQWQTDMVHYLGGYKATNETAEDVLELKVRGIQFTYFANGKKVFTGTLDTDTNWKNTGMFVEDVQTVEFDEITVFEAN